MYRSADMLKGMRISKFRATEAGMDVLEDRPELAELVEQFSHFTERPERCARRYQYVGAGNHSQVCRVDGVAVKIWSRSTGRHHWRYGYNNAEKLIGHLTFLTALGQYFEDRAPGEFMVPAQYFALRTQSGSYLKAEQYMEGWQNLEGWMRTHDVPAQEEGQAYQDVKARVSAMVGHSVLRLGLADLGLGRQELLHARNVLVPAGTTAIEEAPLCIIDQPSSSGTTGMARRLSVTLAALRLQLGGEPGESAPLPAHA